MNNFDNLNFSKLNLVNFDQYVTVTGEIIPGFEFSKYFDLISAPKTHRFLDNKCEGTMLTERKENYKLKHRYRCNKCNQIINMGQYTWFSGRLGD